MELFSLDVTNLVIFFVLVLPFIYEFSHSFRFFLKFAVYYIYLMVFSVAVLPFVVWWPKDVRNTIIATRPLIVLNMMLGLHYTVRGQQHITEDRAAVVVANHQSSIDFLGMAHMWPLFAKITAIAKKEVLYVFPFGITAWLCGTRFIDRRNAEKSKQSMNDALDYVKEQKAKLWVFPEGTRNTEPEMLPFKKGAFHLAISGQLPILPVVYSSYLGFLSTPLRTFNTGNIIVTCLPAIPTKGMTLDDLPKLMEDVRSQMMSVYSEVSSEVRRTQPMLTAEGEKRKNA